ncbi:hypothetical protein BTHERMOSOX_1587 [Bathymodiolus thermophilus thioautotrophic gill symbiont]|nr:hypothetical protein [Bathymodiolus thermophilus thioautotrophic gill symbiont]SGZ68836.1 hypothetical protein BTHERMOSOX_1587 [Bathymodiolus thermophilus thioautotrophic gill symbiont]
MSYDYHTLLLESNLDPLGLNDESSVNFVFILEFTFSIFGLEL